MIKSSLQDGVVLLHGLCRTCNSLLSLQKKLENEGYRTVNINYPSRKLTVEGLVDYIHPMVSKFNEHNKGQLHFVGHSLGGILSRGYIRHYRPRNLGRLVQMGSPNSGSEVASFFHKFWIYQRLFGMTGKQLTLHNNKLRQYLGGVKGYELGSIAGTQWVMPFTQLLFNGKNDGVVAVESTYVDGMKDHIELPVEHTFFAYYECVQKQVVNFLEKGRFKKEAETEQSII